MMTSQDFILIASLLNDANCEASNIVNHDFDSEIERKAVSTALEVLTRRFASQLERNYVRFDKDRFLRAAGIS